MNSTFSFGTTSGLFFFSLAFLASQPIVAQSDAPLPAQDTSEEVFSKQRSWLWRHAQVTGGQMTLPFKIRQSPEHNTFRLTTDVTLGGFVGYSRRISAKKNFHLTIPLTAGVTFINLNSNNTTIDRTEADSQVVPGLTWSTGLILQLDRYSLGLMFGKDYASDVGDQWAYHGKLWWSFGIGFVFLQ